MRPKKLKWKEVRSSSDADLLIDAKAIIKPQEVRFLGRKLSITVQKEIVGKITTAICETTCDTKTFEICTENILIWLGNSMGDLVTQSIIDKFFIESNGIAACKKFVELVLKLDSYDDDYDGEQEPRVLLFEVGVVLICEIGKSIVKRNSMSTKEIDLLLNISCYLQSIANINNYVLRLSLLHYFIYLSKEGYHYNDYNRIMSRFGSSVLDHVFFVLFERKTRKIEGVALYYLLNNISLLLEKNEEDLSHEILKNLFRSYLLKKTDRFSLFIQALGDFLAKTTERKAARIMYLKHLWYLLKIVLRLQNREMIADVMVCIFRIDDPYVAEIGENLLNDEEFTSEQKVFAKYLCENTKRESLDPMNYLRSHKKGRHPKFQKARHDLGFSEQVFSLCFKRYSKTKSNV